MLSFGPEIPFSGKFGPKNENSLIFVMVFVVSKIRYIVEYRLKIFRIGYALNRVWVFLTVACFEIPENFLKN